jgi:hypothetical protein
MIGGGVGVVHTQNRKTMTNKYRELVAIGIGPEFLEVANDVWNECVAAGYDPREVIPKIQEDPSYFLNEGGADGTFGHVQYLDEFSELPSASKLGGMLDEFKSNIKKMVRKFSNE